MKLEMQEFGSRIAVLRKKQGKTQEQLASELGVTFQAVSKWETGAVLSGHYTSAGACGVFPCVDGSTVWLQHVH